MKTCLLCLFVISALGCGRVRFEQVHGGSDGATADSASDGVVSDERRAQACNRRDAAELVHFDFESLPSPSIVDVSGAMHHGQAYDGTYQTAVAQSTEFGCGQAWQPNGNTWVALTAGPHWQLEQGSVEVLLRVPDVQAGTVGNQSSLGILTRDADQRNFAGHFLIGINKDQRLFARMQSTLAAEDVVRCSEPLTVGARVHIGVNFGDPNLELWVDGALAVHEGSEPLFRDAVYTCGSQVFTAGLDGNTQPWVVGASGHESSDGTNDAIDYFLPSDAAIDELRISSERKDFSALSF